jgi:hypothetical protein
MSISAMGGCQLEQAILRQERLVLRVPVLGTKEVEHSSTEGRR